MKKFKILILALLISSCVTVPEVQVPVPDRFGSVKVIKKEEVVDEKTGIISLRVTESLEKAEKSIVDKGAESLLTPQRYANVGSFFGYYSVGLNSEILMSIYNQNSNISDLWIFKSGKIRLTKSSYNNNFPSFSSSGNYVYFTSSRGKNIAGKSEQNSYVWRTLSSGAGGITRIGTPAYSYEYPIESPNGEQILYSSKELYGNNNFIWYMKNNGDLPTQLKQGTAPNWIASNKIIFVARDEHTNLYSIWTCNIDGSKLTQIIADNELHSIQPEPSPNGKYIAYVKQKKGEKNGDSRDIYIYRLADGLSQQITTNESRDDLPKWSKDGQYLFFRSSRGVGWNVWRLPTTFLSDNELNN